MIHTDTREEMVHLFEFIRFVIDKGNRIEGEIKHPCDSLDTRNFIPPADLGMQKEMVNPLLSELGQCEVLIISTRNGK
jgi:hypothetical protein